MKDRIRVIGICAALVAVGYFAPAIMNMLFNAFDMALGWAGSLVVVTVVSGLVGILFLLAFPHVSSQAGIVAVKDRIKFNLLAIRLFPDDLKSVLSSTAKTLAWNFAYIGLNLLPMVVLSAPFMIVWFQLNSLYAFQPVEAGQQQTVLVELQAGVHPQDVSLDLGEGIVLDQRVNLDDSAAPVMLLMVTPATDGALPITLGHGSDSVTKNLEVGTDPQRLSRMQTSQPLTEFAAAHDPIVYFGDPVLPDDGFLQSITIDYQPAALGFLGGGEIDIMIWFVVVSMAVGFALKGAFGVEI
ncbi:MAG: hypothetical protein H8E25_10305 [Planctomycetes bacterium]|nr:hypothetical protein [Planctomycetota bacterium]